MILYKSPHSVSTQTKSLLFSSLRGIQSLSQLSDVDLGLIIDGSYMLELGEKQIVYNADMGIEDVFVVVDGKCVVETVEHQLQRITLTRNNMFGWQHFLHLLTNKQSLHTINYQYRNGFTQSHSTLTVSSPNCYLLRIPYSHLSFVLWDKLQLISLPDKNIIQY